MSAVSQIIESKKWQLTTPQIARVTQLIEKFQTHYLSEQTRLVDITLYPGYFTTLVFELRFRESSNEGGNKTVLYYAKIATLPKKWEQRWRKRIKYEFDCTQQVHDLFNNSDFCEIVRPVAYFEDEAGFVMAEIKGKRLDKMLAESMRPLFAVHPEKLLHAMHESGHWIHEFQNKMPTTEQLSFSAKELEQRMDNYLKSVADETQGTLPHHFIDDLTRRTQQVLDSFSEDDFLVTAKHNDYAPWNMMYGEKGIIAFDFADLEHDSKFYDVYHFTRAINSFKLKPVRNTKIIEVSKAAFLEGYGGDIAIDSPTRLYFNIYFSIERVQMLLRGRRHNVGLVGALKNVSQKRHLKWYLNELARLANC